MVEAVEYALFLLIRGAARLLPFRIAGRIGASLGALVFHLLGFRKRVTLENLQNAFPELSERNRKAIALGAFKNYGTAVLEMLWASQQSDDALRRTVCLQDRTIADRCIEGGKGVILLSGHFGNWEFLIHGLRLHLGRPMVIIVQRQSNRMIDRLIDNGRRRHGNVTIPMGPSSRDALRSLKEGGILAMLGDQSGPKEAAFVPFFGRLAATHRGVAAFSLRSGAPILMAFLVRQSDGTYQALFENVDRSGLDEYSDENIVELTRRHVAVLEQHIRRYPDHWLWMHKRWKHTPGPESPRNATEAA